jgi:hypothetical protein
MYILKYTLAILTLMMPLSMAAQKITLGSVKTKDGGQYQGEIMMGKPHGKGRTVYKTVIPMRANMRKESVRVMAHTSSSMERNRKESGSRTSSMERAHIISQTIIVMKVCGSVTTSMVTG